MGDPRSRKSGTGALLFQKISHEPHAELKKMRDAYEANKNRNNNIKIPTPILATNRRLIQCRVQNATSLDSLWLSNRARAITALSEVWKYTIENTNTVLYEAEPEIKGLGRKIYSEIYKHHNLVQSIVSEGRIDHAVLINEIPENRDQYIHGDLKPDNILVTESDEVYIVDWERAGMGDRELDQASLVAGLLYTSIFSSVKKNNTDWEYIEKSFEDIQKSNKALENDDRLSQRVSQYLAVRALGHIQSIEQVDRCAEILLRISKALV